jgi:hypothetical protein
MRIIGHKKSFFIISWEAVRIEVTDPDPATY